MTAVLLSAGKATRLGLRAPAGCKALLNVGGRTMLDWWRDFYPDLLLVCRTEHATLVPEGVQTVICDEGGGPARALAEALPYCDEGPIIVMYADTWVQEIPQGVEWCGVAAAKGGRNWDVFEAGLCAYRAVPEDEVAVVSVGLYKFAEKWRLALALTHELLHGGDDVGLADVVNDLDLPLEPVVGWRDVGDEQALKRWRAAA